jgi:DNA gyrase subunit B
MVAVQKLVERIERRGVPRAIVDLLLRGRVKDKDFFTDKERLLALIQPLREAKGDGPTAYLEKDEEHGVFDIRFQAGVNGQQREVEVGDEFVSSAEYRALYSAYEEIRELDQPPLTVVDGGETVIESREALVQHVLTEGKKGMTLSRYKGLGEMNADELWETTMDPATRTLLQVRLEDDEAAEIIFTTLMGEAVEPRRQFIEENALNVRNLDI